MRALIMPRMTSAEWSVACAKASAAFTRLATGLRLRVREHRAMAQARDLDDRALSDLGLMRSDLNRICRSGCRLDDVRRQGLADMRIPRGRQQYPLMAPHGWFFN